MKAANLFNGDSEQRISTSFSGKDCQEFFLCNFEFSNAK